MQFSPLFEQALVYATQAHCNQTRKQSGISYIAHILGLTAIAMEYGGNETEAIGALLHDTVEDCGGADRLNDIKARFGEKGDKIVAGCSDIEEKPKPALLERQ